MLLPSKFQPESLPSLGKLVAKAIAPKPVDPIKAFEISDHGSKSAAKLTYGEIIGAAFLRLSDGSCSANGAALIGFSPSPQAEQPAPFKVGQRVELILAAVAKWGGPMTVLCIEDGRVICLHDVCGEGKFSAYRLQLAPSQEAAKGDAEGWIEWLGGERGPVEAGTFIDAKVVQGDEERTHYRQIVAPISACWDITKDYHITHYRLCK